MLVHSLQEMIIKAIASDRLRLPAFPSVAMKLQQALHDRNTRIADLEAMIVGDQALASQILRVANSSFYRGLQTVPTIQKAIIRLGVRQVATLAMAVSQRSLYRVQDPRLDRHMEQLWQHAFASALGSQWVARHCGYQEQAETAFLAGLLHNIGQLVILQVIDELCAGQDLKGAELTEALLLEILDSNMHNAQGYVLMKRWNLPEEYRIVARDHHREPCETGNLLLVIVRLVDQACDKIGIGLRHDPNVALAATPEATHLSINEIQLAKLEILLEDGRDAKIG
jgi:HD-like signal output (HDOD) protein